MKDELKVNVKVNWLGDADTIENAKDMVLCLAGQQPLIVRQKAISRNAFNRFKKWVRSLYFVTSNGNKEFIVHGHRPRN